MARIRITVTPQGSSDAALELEAPDLVTALAVADINAGDGTAQLSENGKAVARITRHAGDHATFWEVS